MLPSGAFLALRQDSIGFKSALHQSIGMASGGEPGKASPSSELGSMLFNQKA
jgi:hypothetical protein